MRRYLQQSSSKLVALSVSLFATAVYLLTMDRSVSWWDCGEFISTSWLLEVGHPPGAPFYQLVAHCFMLLSFGNTMLVAPLSNALSAVCGGITVGVLFLTILELFPKNRFGALVGSLCYLFCDTAWFSAVESEVYSMAMLFCAVDVWVMLCWRRTGNARLIPLVGLLLGLGVCVHMMTLLVTPALALIFFSCIHKTNDLKITYNDKPTASAVHSLQRGAGLGVKGLFAVLALSLFFFLVGLTPYAVIPIRASALSTCDTSTNLINEGNPSTKDNFVKYFQRSQYEKAPIYPRMWRTRDSNNYQYWTYGTNGVLGNVVYFFSYQLTYMYGRYLMYNFIGRENMHWNIICPFVLPMLLGMYGLWLHRCRRRLDYWVVMLLFLFGGVILNIYLNHPCYEPRERDYAYVLSFYAFAIWIGIGVAGLKGKWKYVVLLAPLTMAVGNWTDHDRSGCHSIHDISLAHLQSCDDNAILITLGDNDTFPLWYLQQVEGRRKDISVLNVGLTGYRRVMDIIQNETVRPVYFSYYFVRRYGTMYTDRLRCEGYCWRLLRSSDDGDILDRLPLQRHIQDSIRFNITSHEYIPDVSRGFLDIREELWDVGDRIADYRY